MNNQIQFRQINATRRDIGCDTNAGTAIAQRLQSAKPFRLRQLAYLTRMPGLPHTVRVAAGWLADWGR